MPWAIKDVPRHNKKAKSLALKRLWCRVANAILAESGDEARAIRIANSVIKRRLRKLRKRK